MSSIQLFRDLPEVIILSPGEFVFRAGEPGERMYLIIEGEIDLLVGARIVETAGPGTFIGEMALIDESPRSASARARGEARVFPIDEKRFHELVRQTPSFAVDVMRTLSVRLRRTTQSVSRGAPATPDKRPSKRPASRHKSTRRSR